jgi:hypothetical protein
VTSLTLGTGLSGTLVNGSRFLAHSDAAHPLLPWATTRSCWTMSAWTGIRNSGEVTLGPFSTLDNGAGAISFVGAGRFGFGAGTYPGTVDGGPS